MTPLQLIEPCEKCAEFLIEKQLMPSIGASFD